MIIFMIICASLAADIKDNSRENIRLNTYARAGGIPVDNLGNTPAYISACQTNTNDPHWPPETILAFVHSIGSTHSNYDDEGILYAIVHDKEKMPVYALAWWHFEPEEFMEADGGLLSRVLASDVGNFLRKRPFFLVEDMESSLMGVNDIESCAIKYVETERYLQRK